MPWKFEALKVRVPGPGGIKTSIHNLTSFLNLLSPRPPDPVKVSGTLASMLCDPGKSHVPSHASVALFVNKNNNYVSK